MSSAEEYKIAPDGGIDARVACKDVRFWRMLALEFERIGVELSEYSDGTPPAVLLVDIDDYPSLTPEMRAAGTVIGWTRAQPMNITDDVFSAVLRRPFLTEELLSLVCELTGAPERPCPDPYRRVGVPARRYAIAPTDREGVVSVGAESVRLSPKEWLIFKRLYDAAGQTVERGELARLIGADSGANTTEVHVCHLREKIEKPLGIKVFHTVRGVGYRMSRG